MTTAIATADKVCNECGEAWPADTEFFRRAPDNKDGLGGTCKACRAGYDRERNGTAHRRQGLLTQGLQPVFAALAKHQPQPHHQP